MPHAAHSITAQPAAIPMSPAADLIQRYQQVRSVSEAICAPLAAEDYQIQSIVQTSPPKWHLAHVSWFFETFILIPKLPGYAVFDTRFDFIFNSYYYTHGQMHPRARRGLLSRPTVEQIYAYRAHVDQHMLQLLQQSSLSEALDLQELLVLGLNHEQQHQELMLMDIKHNFWANPLLPAYRQDTSSVPQQPRAMNWLERAGGQIESGYGGEGFAFDNETPRHPLLLRPHRLADRLISNAEYLEFMHDGGYENPALWLADGWALLQSEAWRNPLYWRQQDGVWYEFSLSGLQPLEPAQPVCHISYYEADAYARWAGKRLPLEAELEAVLAEQPVVGNFMQQDILQPTSAGAEGQWFGDLWAWTASPYSAYPGFTPLSGSIGEYNGKFMANQMVLRGGACITPQEHIRASYRNFFYPNERWAFTGLRLAEDL